MMQYTIREANPSDGPAISRIYAPFVQNTPVTFEEQVPDGTAMTRRIEESIQSFPFLIAETNNQPIGYAYATSHRARASFRWSVDVSIYVEPAHHRRGIGRTLYGTLLPLLAEQGFFVAIAGITLPNAASVRLHESIGFEQIGIYKNIGFKLGQWRDVGWWQKQLNTPRANPREPVPWSQMKRLDPVTVQSK
jgi:phosphinothricin acetyltransferase